MNNYRVLTLVNILAMVAIGINSPLLTLYLQGLGADFALISGILTSTIVVMLGASYALGWLADRMGRRKPLYLAGLAGAAIRSRNRHYSEVYARETADEDGDGIPDVYQSPDAR